MASSASSRVAGLRRRITSGFYIRGDRKMNSFSTEKPIEFVSSERPAYYINPLYKMHSREWTEKLHSTIYAAVGRATIKGHFDWKNYKDTPQSELPIITVFGTEKSARQKSGRKAFVESRNNQKFFNPKSRFAGKFNHNRTQYEKASFRGKLAPTFIESYLPYHGYMEKTFFDCPKLFEVKMTLKEFRGIVEKINLRLKATGIDSLGELKSRFNDALHKNDLGKAKKLWGIALDSTNQREAISRLLETAPHEPATYLFYLEASKLLTNKFVKQGMGWLDRNLPKR